MKYKGIELKEFESEKPVLFDPPKRMLVWNNGDDEPSKENVFAFIPNRCYPVIGTNDNLDHCAELKDVIRKHEEKNKWRSPIDEKPERGQLVLVAFSERQKMHYFPIDVVRWDSSYDLGEYEVNAWMPLPQPPKEVE